MKKVCFLLIIGFLASAEARCHIEYVGGLDPYGDGFLSVRTGPGSRYSRIDTLHNGDKVGVCDYSRSWRLVYYGTNGSCYLKYGEPRGDCRRGWVYSRYLR